MAYFMNLGARYNVVMADACHVRFWVTSLSGGAPDVHSF